MQTISINFQVPQGWHELGDKQLRYVYQLLANEFATDEVKTLCLLQWSGTKVIGRQDSGTYLLKKEKSFLKLLPSPSQNCCRISLGSARYRPCPSASPKSIANTHFRLISPKCRLKLSSSAITSIRVISKHKTIIFSTNSAQHSMAKV